jgi:hypothetical protein
VHAYFEKEVDFGCRPREGCVLGKDLNLERKT